MFLELSIITLLLGILFVFVYLKTIKEHIRYWTLMGRLPTIVNKRFLLGHAGIFIGLTPEQGWSLARRVLKKATTPILTCYVGPFLVAVCVMGPEELEAAIGSMKNLEKCEVYFFLKRWLEQGLLTSAGPKWQKRRKILTPAFHFSILLDFIDLFNKEVDNFVNGVEANHLDQPVDVTPLISDYTLLTISETSMGTKLDLQTQEGRNYKKAVDDIGKVVYERIVAPWLWYPRIFDLSSFRKVEYRSLKILHSFTDNIIKKRSENFKTFDEDFENSYTKRKYPLLDILLNTKFKHNSIDDRGIREEVDTFMFEGHDTTAASLNFTTMLLANHAEIQQVYQEIINILGTDLSTKPTYADLQQMSLLESLRLYPPVHIVGRTSSEEITTKYGIIPKGALLVTFIYDLHRNPKYWPDPEKFDPSRHLPENSVGRHPFVYIPFSAGPRNCIGQRFAMLEMKAFFCGVLRKFKLEPVDTPETIVLIQHIILKAKDGVKVKFVLRNKQ
ncbi:unnamed protein product [Ceutorhynchus assimilis]|uniref:Cytochrome P450 n=1 Tax=Ceutorhynchus assimilis TaxID=467358 RepID=A0A9N9QR88_9CUCU|nr:unnamed protein product [Ceutorhynchus assimilis]